MLVSACREGTGSDEMLLPFDGASGPDEVLRRVMADYTVEKDHSYFIARFLARCPNVIALCPGVAAGGPEPAWASSRRGTWRTRWGGRGGASRRGSPARACCSSRAPSGPS